MQQKWLQLACRVNFGQYELIQLLRATYGIKLKNGLNVLKNKALCPLDLALVRTTAQEGCSNTLGFFKHSRGAGATHAGQCTHRHQCAGVLCSVSLVQQGFPVTVVARGRGALTWSGHSYLDNKAHLQLGFIDTRPI